MIFTILEIYGSFRSCTVHIVQKSRFRSNQVSQKVSKKIDLDEYSVKIDINYFPNNGIR